MLNEDVRIDIENSFKEGQGQRFKKVVCPECGNEKVKVTWNELGPDETGTESGGIILRYRYGCGHPDTAMIVANKRNESVIGQAKATFGLG